MKEPYAYLSIDNYLYDEYYDEIVDFFKSINLSFVVGDIEKHPERIENASLLFIVLSTYGRIDFEKDVYSGSKTFLHYYKFIKKNNNPSAIKVLYRIEDIEEWRSYSASIDKHTKYRYISIKSILSSNDFEYDELEKSYTNNKKQMIAVFNSEPRNKISKEYDELSNVILLSNI